MLFFQRAFAWNHRKFSPLIERKKILYRVPSDVILGKYSDFFTSYCKGAIIFLLVENEIVSELFWSLNIRSYLLIFSVRVYQLKPSNIFACLQTMTESSIFYTKEIQPNTISDQKPTIETLSFRLSPTNG